MYFKEGKGYGEISHPLCFPKGTLKSWVRRYRIGNNITKCNEVSLSKEPVKKEWLHDHKQLLMVNYTP